MKGLDWTKEIDKTKRFVAIDTMGLPGLSVGDILECIVPARTNCEAGIFINKSKNDNHIICFWSRLRYEHEEIEINLLDQIRQRQ